MVEAEWTYDNMRSADFDNAWLTVKDAILDKFAGPPDTGVYSPSVQHTLYQAEKTVLEKVTEVRNRAKYLVSDFLVRLKHRIDLTPSDTEIPIKSR